MAKHFPVVLNSLTHLIRPPFQGHQALPELVPAEMKYIHELEEIAESALATSMKPSAVDHGYGFHVQDATCLIFPSTVPWLLLCPIFTDNTS